MASEQKAVSLKCVTCGVLLKSVQEAQTHGEITGHSDFSESTEIIKTMRCTACGKRCRNEQEQKLHSNFNEGHEDFVECEEGDNVVQTSKQFKQMKNEMLEDAGLKTKKIVDDDATVIDDADNEENDGEKIEPEVSKEMLDKLAELGFNHNRSVRALFETQSDSIEQLVTWLTEHQDDKGMDEELLVSKKKASAAAQAKKKLTKEEARIAAEKLRLDIAEKKKKEGVENEKLREKERVKSGKELLEAKKKEDELRFKRNVEVRRMEKEEEEKAREKIRVKLEEDKKERRRKLGLPEELTKEEIEKEKKRLEEKAQKAKEDQERKEKNGVGVLRPVELAEKLRKNLVEIKKTHNASNAAGVEKCYKTLLTYLGNIAKNFNAQPNDEAYEKYRSIKINGKAFLERIKAFDGDVFLKTCGFVQTVDKNGEAVLHLTKENMSLQELQAAGIEIDNALKNPFFGVL
jgi:UBX domain-containing protein 1/4